MLSLKDFKKYKIENAKQISGGIQCNEVFDVLEYLEENDPEQFDAVIDQYNTVGIQCYTSSGELNTLINPEM
jgi:hypothetical protein